MSAVTPDASGERRWRQWLAVRPDGEDSRGRLRRVETIVLLLIALVFAVATAYDLTRQVRIDDRLHADLVSWAAVTGEPYRSAFVELDAKHYTTRDVVCGNAGPASVESRVAECLILRGPVHAGRRAVTGGYYVVEIGRARRRVIDTSRYRYGCFGAAAAEGFRCHLRPAALRSMRLGL